MPNVNVPAPPPSTMPISLADPNIFRASEIAKQRAATAAGKGFAGTVRTSPQGAGPPPLARALYKHVELEHEIPASLFSAVAQVLASYPDDSVLATLLAGGRSDDLAPWSEP